LTGPEPPRPSSEPTAGGAGDQSDPSGPPGRRRSYFTLEGRAAPGLFVLGWLGSIAGLAIIAVAVLSAGPVPQVVLAFSGAAILEIGLIAAGGSQAIERKTRGLEPYVGPSPLLVFVATIPATYLAAVAVGGPLEALGVRLGRPLATLLLVALQEAVNIGLTRLLVVGQGAISWRDMGFGRPAIAAARDLVWGASLAAPVIVATIIVSNVLFAIFKAAPDSPLPPTGTPIGIALSLITGAVLAPIGEEVLFRGVATTAWVRSIGVWPGIVRAALLFGIAHVLTISGTSFGQAAALAIVGFVGRLPVSLVLGWAYVRRGSIWASMGLHATFNGALILLAEFATHVSS
jgi:membrane protease YdiL (CAAX protease family)